MKQLNQTSKLVFAMCSLLWLSLIHQQSVMAIKPAQLCVNTIQETKLAGDANCDGIVNLLDVITIVNYILGLNPEPFCFSNADVNNDGEINLGDLIATVNIIAGGGTFTCGTSTVTDSDGNVYNTVEIGTQCWLKENLKTSKYADGTNIPNVTNASTWVNLTSGAYCWYNNDEIAYKDSYGALYNWYATNSNTNGGKNLCPSGWRVATDVDFTALTTYLGGTIAAGGKLKETGYLHWNSPNTGATNESGFTARGGGSRVYNGSFSSMKTYCWLWTATEQQGNFAWLRNMFHNSSNVGRGNINKNNGQSVRCVKD